MSLLLLLTGYPQGGQGIPPSPPVVVEEEVITRIIPGGAPTRISTRRTETLFPQWIIEEEDEFMILV